ncbi:unnamed protein product [Effrenium voratum]|nr:unnamed protein product [Effrenium voratum]
MVDGMARSRSRSPRRQDRPALACVLFGGPASGKTSLGHRLQARLPGFCHISCGDLARLVTEHQGSPLLRNIAKQLADRRRRKVAFARLVAVVTGVIANGLSLTAGIGGIIVNGLRPGDLPAFQKAVGVKCMALIKLDCPKEVMLARLKSREQREGDARLGLGDMDDARRVDAYLEREAAETEILGAEVALRTFFALDTTAPIEDVAAEALRRLSAFAESLGAAGQEAQRAMLLEQVPAIDWPEQISRTAAALDREFHPDGKPRQSP